MKSSDDGLKQRLIGAIVLLALAVIFVPVLFNRKSLEPIDVKSQIPPKPKVISVKIPSPAPPPEVDLAPEPALMYVPDEATPAEPTPEPIGLSQEGKVKSWVLQVASFRERNHATALTAKLSAQGYTAYTRKSEYKNGAVVRVFVGPKLDKKALLDAQAVIDAKYNLKSILLEFKAK